MDDAFIGSEAVRSGLLTPYTLRTRYVAVHQDVYIAAGADLTPVMRARTAFLRSRRRGVIAGLSAAALYRTKWIDASEICVIDGMRVTTPGRTALDIAYGFRC